MPAVKGDFGACDHIFSLASLDLPANWVKSRMFCNFEKTYPLREVKPLDWNFSLVFQNLTILPYEPLKLSLD